jgi:hypothetical protein
MFHYLDRRIVGCGLLMVNSFRYSFAHIVALIVSGHHEVIYRAGP